MVSLGFRRQPRERGRALPDAQIEPKIRHLVLTCNRLGKLTTTFEDDPKVNAITLDEPTNDKSLVMTSSFTNLVLAARLPGLVGHPEHYQIQTFALYPPEN